MSARFVPSCNNRSSNQLVVRILRLRDSCDPHGDAGYMMDAPEFIPTGSHYSLPVMGSIPTIMPVVQTVSRDAWIER